MNYVQEIILLRLRNAIVVGLVDQATFYINSPQLRQRTDNRIRKLLPIF